MNDIDWSKAPEWATVRLRNISGRQLAWAEAYCEDARTTRDDQDHTFELMVHCWVVIGTRPAQWNGEGRPPVGTVCEVMSATASGEWLQATIVAHDGAVAVYRLYDGSYGGDLEFFEDNPARPLFRLIRTPEQIAADERKAAIDSMVDRFALYAYPDIQWRDLFAQMYDAGCRMTAEQPK